MHVQTFWCLAKGDRVRQIATGHEGTVVRGALGDESPLVRIRFSKEAALALNYSHGSIEEKDRCDWEVIDVVADAMAAAQDRSVKPE